MKQKTQFNLIRAIRLIEPNARAVAASIQEELNWLNANEEGLKTAAANISEVSFKFFPKLMKEGSQISDF